MMMKVVVSPPLRIQRNRSMPLPAGQTQVGNHYRADVLKYCNHISLYIINFIIDIYSILNLYISVLFIIFIGNKNMKYVKNMDFITILGKLSTQKGIISRNTVWSVSLYLDSHQFSGERRTGMRWRNSEDEGAYPFRIKGFRRPFHDTFNRCFPSSTPKNWSASSDSGFREICGKYKGIVSIDGKEICGARTPKGDGSGSFEPLRMVTPGLHPTGVSLGQEKLGKKSNEIKAIPKLIKALWSEGCVITINAIGCQHEIVETIVKNKVDFVICVKDNQKTARHDKELVQGHRLRREQDKRARPHTSHQIPVVIRGRMRPRAKGEEVPARGTTTGWRERYWAGTAVFRSLPHKITTYLKEKRTVERRDTI